MTIFPPRGRKSLEKSNNENSLLGTKLLVYLPTIFSKTELLPADCAPTTAICGNVNVNFAFAAVKIC